MLDFVLFKLVDICSMFVNKIFLLCVIFIVFKFGVVLFFVMFLSCFILNKFFIVINGFGIFV